MRSFFGHGSVLDCFLSEEWLGVPAPVDRDALETSQLRKYYKWLLAWGDWALFQELLRTLKSIAEKHSVSVANVAMR